MSENVATKGVSLEVNDLPPDEAVDRLLNYSAGLPASDLYFSTNENHVAVQVRHLGILRPVTILSPDLGRRCLAYIKAVASMDVAERRRPQDGRWVRKMENESPLDLRLNFIPTLWGEDATLRLLPHDAQLLALDQLGLLPLELNRVLDLLHHPSGLLLVTGPTGSGKTTTLYAFLSHLKTGEKKINTIEDPIEYALPGIRQSQVHPRIDVGFPELLRNILRQAPDIIMIGEIRDPETANIAVRAANSGHLVLATLHAPVAAGAIQSLLSLEVHPHFLASSLLGVITQRLVRTLCPHCKTTYELDEALKTFEEVKQWLEPGTGQVLYGPKGCHLCRGYGYAGRTGIFEVLPVSRDIRKAVMTRQPTQTIRQKAVAEGMLEFRPAALLKVARGETSTEEVLRAVPSEYLGLDD